jgi:hypothetical protein
MPDSRNQHGIKAEGRSRERLFLFLKGWQKVASKFFESPHARFQQNAALPSTWNEGDHGQAVNQTPLQKSAPHRTPAALRLALLQSH